MSESLLYLIDIFGKPVTINFSGRDKFKSKFGALCTIIFIGFVIWAAYNGSKELFSRDNPITVSSETYTQNPRDMILSSETFPIGIGMQLPATNGTLPFYDDSIYTISFSHVKMENIRNPNGTVTRKRKRVNLVKERCTPEHYADGAESYASVDLNLVHCIAREQPELDAVRIGGAEPSDVFEYVLILLKACDNATSPIPCSSPEVIKQSLTRAWFNILYLNVAIDPKNFTHPQVKFRELYSTIIDPLTYREADLWLGHLNVTTDPGWIISEPETKGYLKVNKVDDFFVLEPDPRGIIVASMLFAHNLETSYTRKYKTVQNVLAEVGGLANVGLAILLIITTPYLKLKFCLSLINELFDIYPISSKKDKENEKKRKKALSIEIPDDQDAAQAKTKNTLEVQVIRSDEVKADIPRSNPTYESLNTKSPRYSGLVTEEIKMNLNSNIRSSRSEKDPLTFSPNYLGSPPSHRSENLKRKRTINKNSPDDRDAKRILGIQISKSETREDQDKFIDGNGVPFIFKRHSTEAPGHGITLKINANSESNKNFGRENLTCPPTDFALDINSPLSQQDEKDMLRGKKQDLSKFSSHPKFLRSKSSSLQEIDDNHCLDQKTENSPPKTLGGKIEMAKIEREKTIFTPRSPKKKLTQVTQKIIDQNDNQGFSSILGSDDGFSDLSDNENENDKKPGQTVHFQHKLSSFAEKERNGDSPRAKSDSRNSKGQDSIQINISFWEYIFSFFYKSESHKQKMDILSQGIKNINTRLDLVNILKKLREIDKLKAMLLDLDQAILFNSLPQPQLKPKTVKVSSQDASFTRAILRKSTFVEKAEEPYLLYEAHAKLAEKPKKTKIDQRLIDIYKDKTG